MINLDKLINFIIKHKLTFSQVVFLELLYTKRLDLIRNYKKTFNTGIINKIDLADLISKDFINKTKTGYKITNKFLDLFVDADMAVEEIYDLYPAFITSNEGLNIPLKAMDRKVFRDIYINKINGNLEEHREVLKDIQYGIHTNLINVGINKFLTSEMWKSFRELRQFATRTETSEKTKLPDWDNDF